MFNWTLFFGALLGLYFANALQNALPWEPTSGDLPNWLSMHEFFVQNSLENGPCINAVFIGSSSVEYWGTTGAGIWNSTYAPLGAVNYGIRGDRTENVLWRIQNGELDNMAPKLIVVYIGSNNIITNASIEEIIRGVETIIQEIRARLPTTRILYMEFFPRGGQDIENRWKRIMAVNEVVRQLADGDSLTSFSLFWDLAEAWLTIKEELYESDLLHLNVDGYQQWYTSWNSTFNHLFNAPPLC